VYVPCWFADSSSSFLLFSRTHHTTYSERYLVQFIGPSWNNHVWNGLDIDALFSLYSYCLDQDGRHSRDSGRNIRAARLFVTGLARQNLLYGPRIGARPSHSQRTTTIVAGFALHVWTVPNLQAAGVAPLPDLQSVHLPHGPPVSRSRLVSWRPVVACLLPWFPCISPLSLSCDTTVVLG